MKKTLLGLALVAVIAAGCTGTFPLTNELYQFHREKDRWVDEALFLVFAVTPVYGTALIADAVLLNSIEFWTGKNPLEAGGDKTIPDGDREVIAGEGEESVTMRYDPDTRVVEVYPDAGAGEPFYLAATPSGVIAMDKGGKVLYSSQRDSLGGVRVEDMRNNTSHYFPPEVVNREWDRIGR